MRGIVLRSILSICFVIGTSSLSYTWAAAPAAVSAFTQSQTQDADFAYRGVSLEAPEQEITVKLGSPLFDKEESRMGRALKTLVYSWGTVSVYKKTGLVADITISDAHAIQGRNGLSRGTTSAWIVRNFGKGTPMLIQGQTCLVYTRENHPEERLVLALGAESRALEGMRITSLPLSVQEMYNRELALAKEDEAQGVLPDESVIDISGLPPAKAPVLREALP